LLITAVKSFIALTFGSLNINVMLCINVFAKFASLKTRAIYFVDYSSDPQYCCRCFIYAILSISPLNLLLITAVKYFIALTHGSQNIYVMLWIKNMQNLHP
jgi:hypothetical protein